MAKGKYGPGRFECTAPVPVRGRDKFMFRERQPGELEAEYDDLKRQAQERFNRIQGRKGGLEKARANGPRVSNDQDEGHPYE
jgi:hypothetical protein